MKSDTAVALRGTLPLIPVDTLDRAIKLIEDAEDVEILDVDARKSADQELASIKQMRKLAEEARVSQKAPHLEAGRAVDAQYNQVIEILGSADALLQGKILAFDRARKKELADQQAAVELAAKAEREKLEAKAKHLAATGAPEAAAVLSTLATMVVAPSVPVVVDKSDRSTVPVAYYHAELKGSLTDLVLAIATGSADIGYVTFNEAYANMQARARKIEGELAPGVVSIKTESLKGKGR
jgi:hypothetical protein